MCTTRSARRRGFTLVEMLVALGIIVLVAALGYALLPNLLNNYQRVGSVDRIQQWLLTAKQRAKRDGVPTGVRLVLPRDDNGVYLAYDGNPLSPTNNVIHVRQLQYVQQPDMIAGGVIESTSGAPNWIGGRCVSIVAGLATFAGVDFTLGSADPTEYLVQPGDYLELQDRLVLINPPVGQTTLQLSDTSLNSTSTTGNWRIFRQPRPLLGENVLTIPNNVVIDLGPLGPANMVQSTAIPGTYVPVSLPVGSSAPVNPSLNVPTRTAGGALVLEIVFAPSGQVIGTGVTPGKVLLWTRDPSVDITADPTKSTIISIQSRTGFIGAHESGPPGQWYVYTQDAKASGL